MTKQLLIKILKHSAFGTFVLWHYDIILNCKIQDDLYWIAVCIVVGCYAGLFEFIQPQIKQGSATYGGFLRSCIPLVPYVAYKLIEMGN